MVTAKNVRSVSSKIPQIVINTMKEKKSGVVESKWGST